MSDIITRLRSWSISTNAVPASDIMDEAADEIARLRQDLDRKNLTDAERDAIKACESDYSDNDMDAACWQIAATLRGLLERLK